jgi:hypothetical protein
MEAQELTDFFAHTPWNDMSSYSTAAGPKDGTDAFAWPFGPPPATIHSVSTTIPDQAQLHGFHQLDQNFISPHTPHFASTADDIQAASTLFNHAHMPPPTARSHSFHALSSPSAPPTGQPSNAFPSLPMVPTANGLIHEQLAALLPNHHAEGSIDASLAAQWANSPVQHHHEAHLRQQGLQRPPLKRPYTYGSDSNFHESGFQVSSKHETEDFVVGRLMHDLQHAQPIARDAPSNGDVKPPQSPGGHALVATDNEPSSNDDEDDDDDSSEDRAPKRRKSKVSRPKNGKTANGSRKSISGGKNRKASVDDRVTKKKRGSVAGQKAQRENLSEEQKRNNHILSEQKRRNLIKRGFDDLHDLVPAIRNGGLSKSGILTEAANFLEKLISDNAQYEKMVGPAAG